MVDKLNQYTHIPAGTL